MDDKKFRKLISQAKWYASTRGYDRVAEDFAQDVCIHRMTGRKATIPQLFIDFLRTRYGRMKATGDNARLVFEHGLENAPPIDLEKTAPYEEKHYSEVYRCQRLLSDKSRIIFTLFYIWQFSLREIGECLGVSESRVSQLLSEIHGELKKLLTKAS